MAKSAEKIHTLSNGLVLIGEQNDDNRSCGLGFFVRTGARDETPKEAGLSHFLEHMMFKGTSKRSSMQVTFDLGNIGAQANAYTSDESTVYYAVILPEYFATMQELLSDMLRPSLDPEEFKMEKKVILEEIALYKDRPHYFLFEKALADYFGKHSAGNSVLGTDQSVGAIEVGDMRAYFDRRYAPSNMVLVATGNFNWDSFVNDAEKYCSSWKDFQTGRELSDYTPTVVQKEYRKKNLNQAHVIMMTRGASAQSEQRYALALLATIIGDSSGSRLYWDLVDKGIAEAADLDTDEKDGVGCLMASASTEPESLDKVAGMLKGILTTPNKFSAEDLDRAKTKLITRVVMSGELPMGRLMAIGGDWHYRKRVETLKEVIARIKAVSQKDILDALDQYSFDTWSEFRLLPE